jgi:hypothetical protein
MDLKAYLPKIDPVTGTKIQPQLRDAFADRFDITEQPVLKAINANPDSGSGLNIETVEPLGERFPTGFVPTNENLSRCGFQIVS